jgi:nucleoside-diphosphate kinase
MLPPLPASFEGTTQMSYQRTCAIVKPDAHAKNKVTEILLRIQRAKLLDIRRMLHLPVGDGRVAEHYSCHSGKEFYGALVDFMKSGPLLVMQLEGHDAITFWRELMGPYARPRVPGTIRGDYMSEEDHDMYNLVHGSDSPREADRELELWFPRGGEWWCPGD